MTAPFRQISVFGADPAAELANFEQNVATKMRAVEDQARAPFAIVTPAGATYTARSSDFVRCSSTAITVFLPRADAPDAAMIFVKIDSASAGAVTVRPTDASGTVNGATSHTFNSARQTFRYYPNPDTRDWMTV